MFIQSSLVSNRVDRNVGHDSANVVAGTIGAGGRREFTLIGDTTNVAVRVEQLTKITSDPILLTGFSTAQPRSPVCTRTEGQARPNRRNRP